MIFYFVANEQLANVEQSVQNFDQEIQKLGETITEAKNEASKAKDSVKQQKEAVASTNKEIGQAQGKMEKITKSNKDGELEIQKLEHKMNKASDEAKEVKKIQYFFSTFLISAIFNFWLIIEKKIIIIIKILFVGKENCGSHVSQIRLDCCGYEILWSTQYCL